MERRKKYTLLTYHMNCSIDFLFGHAEVAGLLASGDERVNNYSKYLLECGKRGIAHYNYDCYKEFMCDCARSITSMTRKEAERVMEEGYKVTHMSFTHDEWVKKDGSFGDMYIFEDGIKISSAEFWKNKTDAAYDIRWHIWDRETQPTVVSSSSLM